MAWSVGFRGLGSRGLGSRGLGWDVELWVFHYLAVRFVGGRDVVLLAQCLGVESRIYGSRFRLQDLTFKVLKFRM
jgi:hypothetical protein